ncbi:glycosyltransferase [Duganella sp. HH101]|uniref:glycosyltransferase n=1 Tax=Duganella sp. HH101 TaxID=1781066 RepID=UPI000892EBEC|nr:glycosyltransferase [Duganella sp. HH101]OEZ99884.1 virginiamycin A acetyltransferase [Duganella sp. HH101]
MDNPDIVLSICIPTFNRAPFLQQTLDSIVSQPAFADTHDIEIVIADNASEDETGAVAARYVAAFPGKIQYHRHAETISPDMNFKFVMEHGRGLYLKLHNDNLLVHPGTLAELVKVYRATAAEMPVVFLTNGNHAQGNPIEALTSVSDFVRRVSFMSTWIGGFGMWRSEFHALPDFARNQHLRLVQTDVMLRLLGMGKRAIVLFGHYFSGVPTGRKGNYKKGGYNIAEVFGKNYLSLLKPYLATGQLDRGVYEHEKKLLLIQHIIPCYFDPNNDYQKTGFFEHMQDYVDDDYFYQAVAHLDSDVPPRQAAPAPAPVAAPAPTFEEQKRAYWRALNPHNHTELTMSAGPFDFNRVTVGRMSYGELNVMAYGREGERLTIGNFVSMASEVKFMLGGNHPYEGVSTYPFLVKYFGEMLESTNKGPIVVGDDVWIGYQVLILSGVTIGQGAVIAAGSVVTKDVAPYTIVGGNPAKFIKHRYEPAVIEKMLQFDFSKLSDQTILANRDVLYEPLTADNVDRVIARLTAG